ncbi:SpoIIE family protein phosphatase [Treponema sp.]|uniref:SpoIIE family protein phosphatase n=1 Tax=Treponema sp. TaxID=166 RepID=UPI00388D78F8
MMIKKALLCTVISAAFLFMGYASPYYFEDSFVAPDNKENCWYPNGISSTSRKKTAVYFWQETEGNKIYLSLKNSDDGITWNTNSRFAGPFEYSGDIPQIYSTASNGTTDVLALISDNDEIVIYASKDGFKKFSTKIISHGEGFIGPRVFRNSNGGFTAFVSKPQEDSYTLFYSTSKDGEIWNPFVEFSAPAQIKNTYNPIAPFLVPVKGGDLVVYQAQYTQANLISVQLYSSFTKDGGKNWTKPVLFSGKETTESENFFNFTNQNPYVLNTKNNEVFIAWERSPFYSTNSDIYFARISEQGAYKGQIERISTTGYASKPQLFEFNGTINLVWFTTTSGSRNIYLAQKNGAWWEESEIISSRQAVLPSFMLTNAGKELAFVWEEADSKTNKNGIAILKTDHSIAAPKVTAMNFKDGQRSRQKNIQATLKETQDSSGVKGFSWLWTQDSKKEPEKKITNAPDSTRITTEATKDGTWYLKVRQTDYAGNWSDSAMLTYNLDCTPPAAPSIEDLTSRIPGITDSNTLRFTWTNKEDDDIAGYTYTMKYIAPVPKQLVSNPRRPLRISDEEIKEMADSLFTENEEDMEAEVILPERIVSNKTFADYANIRNGLYVFTIAAIDTVGNIGKQAKYEFIANKYIPTTYITSIKAETDDFGDTELSITGGGFTYDGQITSVYIDRDGLEPYDYTLRLVSGDYKITSNNRIADISMKRINTGDYKIGLMHSDRGLYFSSAPLLNIEERGTTKLKNKNIFAPAWKIFTDTYRKHYNAAVITLVLILLLTIGGMTVSTRSLVKTAKETLIVNAEVRALLEGDIMPQEKKRKAAAYRQKGLSLKAKLVLHSTILIALMDVLIFLGFGYYMIDGQKKTMAQSLHQRVSVMLNSLASGAKVYLPQTTTEDNLSLTDIVNQSSALSESREATITGYSADHTRIGLNNIWATTSKEILSGINENAFLPGVTVLTDEKLAEIFRTCEELNSTAQEQADEISMNITELTKEGLSLISKSDAKSVARRQEIQTIRNQLNVKLDGILNEISREAEGSIPAFSAENIDTENTEYVFYKPLLYKTGNDANYVHGAVLIKISTESLLAQIENERNLIINTCIIVLIIALILAFLSTYFMATMIVRPIKKLVSHVALIRDTEDKEKLSGHAIAIKSHDEIGMLGDTVNEMTRGLVEAAIQSKNLTLGKDIQTKFIPLEIKDGITMTTGNLKAKGADFFSYYAGADELSGDYFDYKQLDDKHYAIIKCDVSGHGVPAALIMVEVATLFLNSFKTWSMKNPNQGINIAPVVGQINDLLESRGFKGRFAAFTLCIMNTETGDCWFCNAGDNLVHIYSGSQQKKNVIKLQETPAAGIFSTDLVDMKGGYKVSKLTLKKDDVLFLFTDGIEEAKRIFRDENFAPTVCAEPGLEKDQEHENHKCGEDNEEMSPERVTEIIESVYARRKFKLHKFHAPSHQSDFDFDFSTCDGTADDAILALVSVEKVFRLYKPGNVIHSDRVKVDKNIDNFLRQHFVQYPAFCSDREDIENDPSHIYWCGVKEDPQYDDLTLIAVKKG